MTKPMSKLAAEHHVRNVNRVEKSARKIIRTQGHSLSRTDQRKCRPQERFAVLVFHDLRKQKDNDPAPSTDLINKIMLTLAGPESACPFDDITDEKGVKVYAERRKDNKAKQ